MARSVVPSLSGANLKRPGRATSPPARRPRDEMERAPAAPSPALVARRCREAATSLLSELPAGATFGTFVHRVLERVDFTAPDLRSVLLEAINAEQTGYPESTTGDPTQLAIGLEAAISMPLGGSAGEFRLRDLSTTDRLDELAFELPLAGGDDPVGDVLVTDLAKLFSRHVRPGAPLAAYVTDLSRPNLAANLRGYLTGSLDLVFRLRPAGGPERFFVVDYKTNWLGRPWRRADRLALPCPRHRGRNAASRLPAPGDALPRRAAPVPALASTGVRPCGQSGRGFLLVPAGHGLPWPGSGRAWPVRHFRLEPSFRAGDRAVGSSGWPARIGSCRMIGGEPGWRITERPPLGTICVQKLSEIVLSDLEAGRRWEVRGSRVTGFEATRFAGTAAWLAGNDGRRV